MAAIVRASPADAQPMPGAEVEAAYRRGQALRAEGRAAEAAEVFHQVWDRTRQPAALARWALAEAAAGRWVIAEEHLETALRMSADPFIHGNAEVLRQNLSIIRDHLGSLRVETDLPSAELWIDGALRANLPLRDPLRVTTGAHAVMVRSPGRSSANYTVHVTPGGAAEVHDDSARADSPRAAPRPGPLPGRGAVPQPPPPPPPHPAAFPRLSLDLGGGVGLAFVSGRPSYAEMRTVVDAMGNRIGTDCGMYVCSTNVDPGFNPTYYLYVGARFNFSRRAGIGVGLRYQFDTADTSLRDQTLSDMLFSARAYLALNQQGFSMSAFTTSLFLGIGVGQIEPKTSLPSRETRSSAHVVSGPFNAHLGLRLEVPLSRHLHAASEIAAQFMFPTFLFDLDLTLAFGVHL